ncbi:MAG: U32 family peptidase [Rikenellaceae bacterium]|nr:U32 family peptidase [Rikenellaceae bacterium]
MRKPELLAPAKNLEFGKTAVDYGADAVYIGAPMFSARCAAGNSMADIGELVKYAHRYGVKVYMAMNTVLYDDELEQARMFATEAWERGVDALIVQDMSFLEMDIPPIPLHASTQAFITDPVKAKFLEDAGFSRLILERALSLEEIRAIREAITVGLEVFVHGAVCVCYSGQCYMSHIVSGKSGNRGECRQPCRWDYDLIGNGGRKITSGAHLLSVRDLNLSSSLRDLIDAGADSFKIEGGLKDITYLKNTVSNYRKELDRIIESDEELARPSYGSSASIKDSDLNKTFTRGFTDYYLFGNGNKVSNFNTPKSIGEYIGKIQSVSGNNFIVDTDKQLNNGDGLFFISDNEETAGANVNIVDGRVVYPNKTEGIKAGMEVYRNYDRKFVNYLERHTSVRLIDLKAELYTASDKIVFKVIAPDGINAEITINGEFAEAENKIQNKEKIEENLRKTGGTAYRLAELGIYGKDIFIPVSVITSLRRDVLKMLDIKRQSLYRREMRPVGRYSVKTDRKELDYRANITNRLAELFYRECGVEKIEKGPELCRDHIGKEAMRTKYCVRREMDRCLKDCGSADREDWRIINKDHIFDLRFDCERCEMSIVYAGKNNKK